MFQHQHEDVGRFGKGIFAQSAQGVCSEQQLLDGVWQTPGNLVGAQNYSAHAMHEERKNISASKYRSQSSPASGLVLTCRGNTLEDKWLVEAY